MRCVSYNSSKIEYPDGWQEKADKATEEITHIAETNPESLSQELKKEKYREIWSALKLPLSNVFYKKCWYTECPQIGTDTDVDHFRPKLSVRGIKNSKTGNPHRGYWWLVFKPENYRFSCIVANRPRRDLDTEILGGKADEFPLWNDDARAWGPSDDTREELPLLIDPCNPDEVAYITFTAVGEAIEKYEEKVKEKPYKMAHESIRLYHLNHNDFVKARVEIRDRINNDIRSAKWYYKKLNNPTPVIENAYREAIMRLRQARNEAAPFSSFAYALLEAYKLDECLEGVFQ